MLLILSACPLVTAGTALAQDICSPSYEAASQSVQQVATRGLRTSLIRKVDSAWKQSRLGYSSCFHSFVRSRPKQTAKLEERSSKPARS
jgi:hypothetical protein